MFDVIPMPWDWPVEVNYHEARAYCRWKGASYRLPSEAERNIMIADMVSGGSSLIGQRTFELNNYPLVLKTDQEKKLTQSCSAIYLLNLINIHILNYSLLVFACYLTGFSNRRN